MTTAIFAPCRTLSRLTAVTGSTSSKNDQTTQRATFATLLCLALCAPAMASAAPPAATQRCGWFENPTPGNAYLKDHDGEWTVAEQGMHQAKGVWPPKFKPGQWVKTGNGSYGYGCACLKVMADESTMQVTRIISSVSRPLAVCRKDATLTEPENPLK